MRAKRENLVEAILPKPWKPAALLQQVTHTLKLATDGAVLWSDSFTPSIFWGTGSGIAVTASGVYTAAGGLVTARNLQGLVLWEKDMILPNGGSALAADGAGNIYLAAQNGVAKFDSLGNSLGVFGGISSQVSDLDVDAAGNIYLVGSTVATSSRGRNVIRSNAARSPPAIVEYVAASSFSFAASSNSGTLTMSSIRGSRRGGDDVPLA